MYCGSDIIKQYKFKLIYKEYNEVYRGINESDTCIMKYIDCCDGYESNEIEILNYLKHKPINIPRILYHNIGDNKSPSGKLFRHLIITTEIKGKLFTGMHGINGNNNRGKHLVDTITKDEIPKNVAISIIKQLIDIIFTLHSYGIIYGDTFNNNFIVDESYNVTLLDFGESFFINNHPPFKIQILKERPLKSIDISSLLSIKSHLLNLQPTDENKDRWDYMEISDII